jgi:hypothetical protein
MENAPIDIIEEITSYLKRYMVFTNEDQPLALALWAIHTHTFSPGFPRAPWVTPYLYVNSAGPACGKTLLIELLEGIVLNPEKGGSMSSATMYRLIEAVHPTIMVDEVDTIWNGAKNEDLRNTLNTGYKHGGYTWRTEGGEPVKFSTFTPKLLAGIRDSQHEIPETVRTRSIPITLHRKPAGSQTEIYYSFMGGPVAERIAELIVTWVKVYALKISEYMPKPVQDMTPRGFEISMPLLQIAHAAGIETQAREALVRLLAPEPEKEDTQARMLRIIWEAFDLSGLDKIHTATLCEALGGVTGKHLANSLKPLGITGNNTMQIGTKVAKGYWRYQFEEAWERMGI